MLLATGLALGFRGSLKVNAKFWNNLPKDWKKIGRTTLWRIINEFKYKRLVDFKEERDGSVSVVLSRLGKKHAIRYDPENIKIRKPSHWDKKWRIVVFDIPEKKRIARDTLRREVKKIGFFEMQKSVWVFPYECEDAIDFLVELYEVRNYVRYLTTEKISHDADLKLHFDLT